MNINFNTVETHKFNIGCLYECTSATPEYLFQPLENTSLDFVAPKEIIMVLTGPVELVGLPTKHCFYKIVTSQGKLGYILASSVIKKNHFSVKT
jgi:hypothetical protein